jgi:outer membrane murein-binding lipoprotein Lpp
MATDKTPAHKRAARAEKRSNEWKMKAIERREENECLDLKIKDMETKIAKFDDFINKINDLNTQMELLKNDLEKERLIIAELQSENAELKKKHFFKRFKTI